MLKKRGDNNFSCELYVPRIDVKYIYDPRTLQLWEEESPHETRVIATGLQQIKEFEEQEWLEPLTDLRGWLRQIYLEAWEGDRKKEENACD